MVLRYMQNCDPWGSHMTRVMTIFLFYASPSIPNIETNQLYEVYKSRGHLIFCLIKFTGCRLCRRPIQQSTIGCLEVERIGKVR